jgi:L-lactate dehydrogenase complex protein LldG
VSAREEVLGRVRTAIAGAPAAEPVPRDYRRPSALAGEALLALLVERVEDYRATVTRCSEAEVTGCVARLLGDAARVVVPPGLPWPVEGAEEDAGSSAAGLDAVEAVVTGATVAIAETGTIVLTHGPGEGRRALSLVPDVHVCVVRSDQVVAGVAEGVAALDPGRPQTWISGPSATSDIELDRVEGVHGPRTLHVVLVG